MNNRSREFQAATESQEQNLLVIAPPGCGKTELLAHRAARQIGSLRTGRRILALTFSNKAKANLNSRLVAVIGAERKRRFLSVHNFHGHAAEIVRSHGQTLGIPTDFEVPTKHTQDEAIAPFLEGLTETEGLDAARLIGDELREAKQGPFDDAQVLERLRISGDSKSVLVEEYRQRTGVLFFDDLLRHAQRLLAVPEVARLYRNHYSSVIVDEFQDLSLQQLDIVLRSADNSRTFVGDPLQGIYSWAGARPVEVEKILRRISGEPLGLGTSFRSSPKVLHLLAQVSLSMGGHALESNEPGAWFESGATAGFAFPDAASEAEYIRTTALKIIARNPTATVGVICRSGWRRKPIDAQFSKSGTACTRWDFAIDNPDVVALIQGAASRLGGNPDLPDLEADLLSTLPTTETELASDVRDAISQLEDLVQQAGSVERALSQLHVNDSDDDAIAPGIHLLNAHIGKGQQFDWVFVPGFEQGNMPSFLSTTPSALAEEKRVLLVVISRARHAVIVTRAKQLISKRGKPYEPKLSPYVAEIRNALTMSREQIDSHIARMPSSLLPLPSGSSNGALQYG